MPTFADSTSIYRSTTNCSPRKLRTAREGDFRFFEASDAARQEHLARATGLDLFNFRFPCWHQSHGIEVSDQ